MKKEIKSLSQINKQYLEYEKKNGLNKQRAFQYYEYLNQNGYQYVSEIGRGGFGTVILAKDLQFNHQVAIKILLQTTTVELICQELTILRLLKNKNQFSQVLNAFKHEETIHIVFEYFEHDKLQKILKLSDINIIQNYMKNLLEALLELKKLNFVHRDIKSLNFLYNIKKQKGLLIDFGVTQICNNQFKNNQKSRCQIILEALHKITSTNKLGTEQFMPFESIIRNENQDFQVDIWAAGIIFLQLLTKKSQIFQKKEIIKNNKKHNFFIQLIFQASQLISQESVFQYLQKNGIQCQFQNIQFKKFDLLSLIQKIQKQKSQKINQAYNLLTKMLIIDPNQRITVEHSLQHEFFK